MAASAHPAPMRKRDIIRSLLVPRCCRKSGAHSPERPDSESASDCSDAPRAAPRWSAEDVALPRVKDVLMEIQGQKAASQAIGGTGTAAFAQLSTTGPHDLSGESGRSAPADGPRDAKGAELSADGGASDTASTGEADGSLDVSATDSGCLTRDSSSATNSAAERLPSPPGQGQTAAGEVDRRSPASRRAAGSPLRGSSPTSLASPLPAEVARLDVALEACEAELEALEGRAAALQTDAARAQELLEDCLALSQRVEDVAVDAMEHGCGGMSGAMDTYERSNAAVERLATCLQLCKRAGLPHDAASPPGN